MKITIDLESLDNTELATLLVATTWFADSNPYRNKIRELGDKRIGRQQFDRLVEYQIKSRDLGDKAARNWLKKKNTAQGIS